MTFLGVAGASTLLLIGFILSNNRSAIKLRTVGGALLLQISIGAFVLYIPAGRSALQWLTGGVEAVLQSGQAGINFLFGNLVNFSIEGIGFVFALRSLPLVIFFSGLIAVLYYLGVMQLFIRVIGGAMSKLLRTSKAESMSAVSNIFVGQNEAPLVVKPIMPKMTDSEFFTVMCGGMASVSGTILSTYAALGVNIEYLLAASFMAAPGGVLFAKLLFPETQKVEYVINASTNFGDERPINLLAAAGQGASSGLQLAGAIGAILITMIGLVTLANSILGGIGDLFNVQLSLELMLGWLLSPIAFLLGVPWSEADVAGAMIGKKVIVNEFVAYIDFSQYLKDPQQVVAAGLPVLSEKAKIIISFALCGFANISSMGILIGGLGSLCPTRADFIARYGLKTLIAATCSNLMSAAIAGIFLSLAES